MKRLKYFESLTLEQAQQNKVIGEYDMVDCLNKSATKVLAQQYEGQDTLTKLVIEPSGAGRLFAIREGHELHVLWWHANHEVWPEGKTKR